MLKNQIPFVDLREKTLVDLVRMYPDKVTALLDASTRTFGLASRMTSFFALPYADYRSHKWLSKNNNPFLFEIESIADIVDQPGVYALNLSYEWGCTGGAYRSETGVSMLRVLDWPFPEMGQHVVIALHSGKAGDYYNVTWPGFTGMLNGMAPNRFCAAINQAPMRKHGSPYVVDWLKNRMITDQEHGLPPTHLLRMVFERAKNYDEAKEMLSDTRVALPSIFMLSGTKAGEGCIIERLENTAEVIELGARQQLPAANHFTSSLTTVGDGWRPRTEDSHLRYKQAEEILGHELDAPHFEWLRGPIISHLTRLCCACDASSGKLVVQGYEGVSAVTEPYTLSPKLFTESEAI